VRLEEGPVDALLANTPLLDPSYNASKASMAGRGIRPRHLVIGAAVMAVGVGLWFAWRRARRN
jgi:hypothetical protein